MSSVGPSPLAPPAHGRQRPGSACEECRSRKLRCDGMQPCSVCVDSGVACEVNTQRGQRGPKKVYRKSPRTQRLLAQSLPGRSCTSCHPLISSQSKLSRTELLEALLESRLAAQSQPDEPVFDPELITPPTTAYAAGAEGSYLTDYDQIATRTVSEPDPSIFSHSAFVSTTSPSSPPTDGSNLQVSDLMQAELDQLYFDRVHLSIPILHQRRYLSWSKQAVKKPSRICLQRAMWTLASLLSAQFQHLQESLFQSTKQLLESLPLCVSGQDQVDTEQAQSWILVATYESMKTQHGAAWMSAGRAFRLVQLMRLHEIDSPITGTSHDVDYIETEQRRRVFWMAYFLDHLFSIRNSSSVTLNEHMICTRLPTSEAAFQSGQPSVGSFLSEALTEDVVQTRSYFNECIILATICGRSLFHGQQYHIRAVYGDVFQGLSDQHRVLDDILSKRLRILSQNYPSVVETSDPMLLFLNIMGQATVIYLYKGIQSIPWTLDGTSELILDYQQRALAASERIVSFAKALTDFHLFKVHALMPLPLLICAEFLYSNKASVGPFNAILQALIAIFRQLKNVNDPTQSYIQLLELSCVPASSELAKDAV